MSKKLSDEVTGLLIVLGLIIGAITWLYNTFPILFWFVVIILALFFLLALIGHFSTEGKSSTTVTTRKKRSGESPTKSASSQSSASAGDTWLAHCIEVENAWSRGDYDWARMQLQKIAYGMVGDAVTDAQRADFTRLMTEFAKEDPLYRDVMARVLPLVQANPGMLQSQIYKGQPDNIKEQMRYVLYFAHELGHIHREKKGNSYKLYPPEVKEMYGNKFIAVGRENGIVTYETLPKSVGGTGAQITATIDEESAELLREAARLKGEKDWNGAIEALKKADARTGTVGVRLPLYLQQAGRFEEAMAAFNKLLSEIELQVVKDFSHHPERFWDGFSYFPRSNIYDKMRLACKRQKLPEEAEKYEALRDEFLKKHEKFSSEFDSWHRKDLEQRIVNRGF